MTKKDVLQVCGCQKILDVTALACDVEVCGAVEGVLYEGLRPCAVVGCKDGVVAIAIPQGILQPGALQQRIKKCLHSNDVYLS